jgi:hypothetical protein
MSKKAGPVRVKLSDFKERKELEGAIEIETDDGQVFRLPPPEVWPDEVEELYRKREIVSMCRAIMGDEPYDRYVAAGGSASLLNAIFAEYHGTSAGE